MNAALLKARKKLGLSQRELGKRTGIHFTAISLYERGEEMPGLRAALALSQELGVTPEEILKGGDKHDRN